MAKLQNEGRLQRNKLEKRGNILRKARSDLKKTKATMLKLLRAQKKLRNQMRISGARSAVRRMTMNGSAISSAAAPRSGRRKDSADNKLAALKSSTVEASISLLESAIVRRATKSILCSHVQQDLEKRAEVLQALIPAMEAKDADEVESLQLQLEFLSQQVREKRDEIRSLDNQEQEEAKLADGKQVDEQVLGSIGIDEARMLLKSLVASQVACHTEMLRQRQCALAVTDKRDEATRERDAARAALAQLRFDQESQLEQLQQEHSMEVLTMLEGKDSAIGEGSAAFQRLKDAFGAERSKMQKQIDNLQSELHSLHERHDAAEKKLASTEEELSDARERLSIAKTMALESSEASKTATKELHELWQEVGTSKEARMRSLDAISKIVPREFSTMVSEVKEKRDELRKSISTSEEAIQTLCLQLGVSEPPIGSDEATETLLQLNKVLADKHENLARKVGERRKILEDLLSRSHSAISAMKIESLENFLPTIHGKGDEGSSSVDDLVTFLESKEEDALFDLREDRISSLKVGMGPLLAEKSKREARVAALHCQLRDSASILGIMDAASLTHALSIKISTAGSLSVKDFDVEFVWDTITAQLGDFIAIDTSTMTLLEDVSSKLVDLIRERKKHAQKIELLLERLGKVVDMERDSPPSSMDEGGDLATPMLLSKEDLLRNLLGGAATSERNDLIERIQWLWKTLSIPKKDQKLSNTAVSKDEALDAKTGDDLDAAVATVCSDILELRSIRDSLEDRWQTMQAVLQVVARIRAMEEKMQEFERSASDKSRLRRGGTRLLEEERFRRKFAATYPTLLTKVKNLISQWETRQKLPFKVGNAALGDLVNDVLQCHKALTAGSRLHKAEAIRLATLIDRAQGADKKHIAKKNDDENVMHQAETENEAKASKTIEKEHADEVVENGKPLRTRHRRVSSDPSPLKAVQLNKNAALARAGIRIPKSRTSSKRTNLSSLFEKAKAQTGTK